MGGGGGLPAPPSSLILQKCVIALFLCHYRGVCRVMETRFNESHLFNLGGCKAKKNWKPKNQLFCN